MGISKKADREHWKYDEIKRMRKYKFEFTRRNSRIKGLIEQLHKAGSSTPEEWAQKRFEVWNELIEKFHFHTAEINDFILAMGIKDHRAYSLIKTSSVNIVFQEKGKSYALPLDYNEINFKDPNSKGFYRPRIIEAINPDEGTITLQVKFYQNMGKIRKDITFLLCLVSEELKLHGIRLNEPKHRWEDYENYLKVWDRKEEGWGPRKIAEEIYPEDAPEEARRKVRNLLKQARKMVEGGFSMI